MIVLTAQDEILWNGKPVTLENLRANLEETKAFSVEPELQFEPDSHASYDLSVQVLNVIRDSGVSKFGFVGNEKYVTPGKE